jgi:hypothetical protein
MKPRGHVLLAPPQRPGFSRQDNTYSVAAAVIACWTE